MCASSSAEPRAARASSTPGDARAAPMAVGWWAEVSVSALRVVGGGVCQWLGGALCDDGEPKDGYTHPRAT